MSFRTLALAACVAATMLPAQSDKEIEAAKRKILAVHEKAVALKQAGRVEEAEKLARQVSQMKEKLAHSMQGHPHHGDDAHHDLFLHLKSAIHALKKSGREEDAVRLEAWTRKIHEDLQHGEPKARKAKKKAKKQKEAKRPEMARKGRGDDRTMGEKERGKQQLGLLLLGSGVLRKAGREDGADVLKNSAEVLRARLSGKATDRRLDRRQTARQLASAAEFLKQHGDGRWEALAKASREFASQGGPDGAQADRRRRVVREEEVQRREPEIRGEQRIRRLEEQVAHLTRLIQEMRRDRDRRDL